ncbi:MAG TPA: DUF456 domain-containing protein [Acidimicrobiia bacterium]|nr:DUF456 domain-containing protein [Acidimicrobiia bacterium]
MELHDFLAGIAVLVGLVGTVVAIIPGIVLQVVAVGIWALEESSVIGWIVLGLVFSLAVAATVLKYAFPGRRLREVGIPRSVLFLAVFAGTIGLFFAVVGGPLAFLGVIYLFERARVGAERAWTSTKEAARAVMTSVGIELAGASLILVVFAVGAVLT